MLFPSPYLALFLLDPGFAISLVLNTLQNSDGPMTLTEPTLILPSLNASAVDNSTIKDTALNLISSTYLTIPKIDCDDGRFGTPPVASCTDAIAEIPQDPATVIRDPNRSYGPRGEGTWDVNLPKRYISSDGQCIIDLTQTSTPSHVKNNDLLAVASIIQHECVEGDTPPWGGQGIDMAEESNFQLTMKSYSPPFVRCSSTPPAVRPVSTSCQTILNTMKASVDLTTFGAVGIFGVEEYLPQVLTEPTGKCSITVDTTAPDDAASWYDLWQAAVALDGMCARAGRAGKSRFLGIGRKLVMEMKKS